MINKYSEMTKEVQDYVLFGDDFTITDDDLVYDPDENIQELRVEIADLKGEGICNVET